MTQIHGETNIWEGAELRKEWVWDGKESYTATPGTTFLSPSGL